MLFGNEVDRAIDNHELKEDDRLEYLKLGLDDSSHTEGLRETILARLDKLPPDCPTRSIDQVVGAFLEYLYRSALLRIQDTIHTPNSSAFLPRTQVVSIVCVPANWSYALKHRMKTIAANAGLPKVELMTEPDAVATFVIHGEMKSYATHEHQIMDEMDDQNSILIVDVGGCTGVCFILGILFLLIANATSGFRDFHVRQGRVTCEEESGLQSHW